uniref:NAD-dependent epimerase/dehydratase domain-containing protein n=1 Tax=Oryza punctata TaxID=4537 RepID=A0A0E0JGN8_ORYPU
MVPGPAAPMAAAAAASPPQPRPGHMLVLGTGFVGRYVSQRLLAQGWRVSGTCTSAAKKTELEMLGMDASVFDATSNRCWFFLLSCSCSFEFYMIAVVYVNYSLTNLQPLREATHLLISIPPIPGIGDPLLSSHSDLQTTLSDSNLQWLCYLSSTSVYGDCGGVWVDEDHTVNPKSESAKLRYAAEKGWLNVIDDLDLSAFIFRLGGIYGPGRSAVDTIAKSKSLSRSQKLRESKQYTARIHVADIYQAILASMSIRSARRIYNVVDDDPAPRSEVFAFARSLVERKHPGLIMDSVVPATQDRIVAAEKRVCNARLKEELGVRLLHPTYKSGLQSILDSWSVESSFSNRNVDV